MIDLHMHTTFSDGSISPKELVEMAVAHGIQAVAITDHDNTQSYLAALDAAKDLPIDIIPGIEINTWWQGQEVHVLGYYLDLDHPSIQAICQQHYCARQQQMQDLAVRINKLGKFPFKVEDIQAQSRDGGSMGRPHVAKAIVQNGGAANMSEAFRKYLVPNSPTYCSRPTVTPHEAVEAIYDSGGIAVIAHPGDMAIIEELSTDLMNYGLRGLEAYHKSHSPAEIEFHCSLAERLGLIVTGGTDFHGTVELYPNALGRLHMPEWVYDQLKQEKSRIDLRSVKVS
jgi:3',5'-nucleoside bisphosphate phosphatase